MNMKLSTTKSQIAGLIIVYLTFTVDFAFGERIEAIERHSDVYSKADNFLRGVLAKAIYTLPEDLSGEFSDDIKVFYKRQLTIVRINRDFSLRYVEEGQKALRTARIENDPLKRCFAALSLSQSYFALYRNLSDCERFFKLFGKYLSPEVRDVLPLELSKLISSIGLQGDLAAEIL